MMPSTIFTKSRRPAPHHFKGHHLFELGKSGIDINVAKALDLWSADADEVQQLLHRTRSVGPGLVIPYYDPLTESRLQVTLNDCQYSYVRVRLDDPKCAATASRPDGAKYLAARGSGQFPYVTPSLARALKVGDVTSVLITEGEKKAISGCHSGLHVIGLPGNWGFKVKDQNQLHPWLAQLLRRDMKVYVVWDSDAALNPSFAAATRMFHDCLSRQGCRVYALALPQDGVEKIGLDDYLVRHGKDQLASFLASIDPLPADRQVKPDELLRAWLDALKPAFTGLPADGGRQLLRKAWTKGYLDNVPLDLRTETLRRLQEWAQWDVNQLAYELAREYAVEGREPEVRS